MSHFCNYIKSYVDAEEPEEADPQDTAMKLMEKDFICQQLIKMLTLFDLSDEVSFLLKLIKMIQIQNNFSL